MSGNNMWCHKCKSHHHPVDDCEIANESEIKWPEVEEACKRVGNEIELQEEKGTSSTKFEGFIEDLKVILFWYWVANKDLEKIKQMRDGK